MSPSSIRLGGGSPKGKGGKGGRPGGGTPSILAPPRKSDQYKKPTLDNAYLKKNYAKILKCDDVSAAGKGARDRNFARSRDGGRYVCLPCSLNCLPVSTVCLSQLLSACLNCLPVSTNNERRWQCGDPFRWHGHADWNAERYR